MPNSLVELTRFIREEVPSGITRQQLLTTKPWLDLAREGAESVEVAKMLKECLPLTGHQPTNLDLLPAPLALSCESKPSPPPPILSHSISFGLATRLSAI